MKITKKVEKAVNAQINAELYSEYLYLAMAAWFDANNLPGFAHWMHKQALEEHSHAMKLYKYVFDRGGIVELEAIAKPESKWKSPLEIFRASYGHEQLVTKLIHELSDLARTQNDKATESMLTWFIDEQVEEEANALQIVEQLAKIGESTNGIYMVDHRLGKRE